MTLSTFRPTTGYEDVKMVAIARLAAPNIPSIQVDWRRYGPKLAQVALTFGADDIDGVSPSDEAPEGRRRAPLEEIRRNIEAAGFEPVERRRPLRGDSALMTRSRIGAVGYLNARPLTWALDRDPSRWHVRYDLPAGVRALLHDGEVDLGLIPSIEYLQSRRLSLCARGRHRVARGESRLWRSTRRKPIEEIRRIALDTSSRTSVALIQVLCRHHFHISPSFVPHGPDLAAMTSRPATPACSSAIPAFDADHAALGLQKIDLGEVWTQMTGLPFIYAAWTGRPGAVDAGGCRALAAGAGRGCARAEKRLRRNTAPATSRVRPGLRCT